MAARLGGVIHLCAARELAPLVEQLKRVCGSRALLCQPEQVCSCCCDAGCPLSPPAGKVPLLTACLPTWPDLQTQEEKAALQQRVDSLKAMVAQVGS